MKKYKKKRDIKRVSILSGAVLVLLVVGYKLLQIYNSIEITNFNRVEAGRLSQTIEEKKQEDVTIAQMLEDVMGSIVGISKLKENGNTVFEENGVSQLGIGSGVIISEEGYILTNEHVSGSKNSTCYVTMEDGNNYNAKVVWSDSNLDLAIIKINMKCIYFAKLGDSNSIKVGESVYAIGNPIGFEFQKTVTSGIISALNRTIVFSESNQT